MNAHLLLIAISLATFLAGVALPLGIGRFGNRRQFEQPRPRPLRLGASIEIIIPAYLEAGEIDQTIQALRPQLANWPGDASITVVASDDATSRAASAADKILSVGRAGKPMACNLGVTDSQADIILFMDANCRIIPDDWARLLHLHLQNWSLVSADKRESNGSETAFWRLESAIKRGSSGSIGSLAVVGEFVAFRRIDYRLLPTTVVLDDLWLAFDFHQNGLSVTVSSDIATTEPAASRRDQWERRVRISAGLLTEAIPRLPWLMTTPAGRIYAAHKLYRATLGVAAFWTAVAASAMLFPIVTAPLAILVIGLAVAHSSGRIPFKLPFGQFFSLVGLQAVPLAGAFRALQRVTRASKEHVNNGWTKIAR
ncbi:UNVERIFIED_ORG: hypothetical protein ABIB19_003551 [Arthrobacter sp. UYEF10]